MSLFAVFSAWRSDKALLVQTVRSAVRVVKEKDEELGGDAEPACEVKVTVQDDLEVFDSADDLRDSVTAQALRDFKGVAIEVAGPTVSVHVRMVRESTEHVALPHVPGVLVEADAPHEETAGRVRDAVAATVARGGFWFSREPVCGSSEENAEPRLRTQIRRRNAKMSVLYGVLFAVTLIAAPLIADSLSDGPSDDMAAIAVIALIAGVPLVVLIAGRLPDSWRTRLRRLVDNAVFPAVEISDVQPGRRWIGRAVRLAPLAAAPIVSELAGLLPD